MTDQQLSATDAQQSVAEMARPESEMEAGKQQQELPQSVDELKTLVSSLQRRIAELNAENKRHRLRANELERIEAERQAEERKRVEAEMSEVERLRARLAELERDYNRLLEQTHAARVRAAVEAAARRAGVPEDELDTVYALVDMTNIVADDDGVRGADEAVRELLKRKPRLVASPLSTDINATTRGKQQFAVSDETEREIARRYGIRMGR